MHSTIAAERIESGTFATWETDGRGLRISDVYIGSAQSEEEARAAFVAARVYKLRDTITERETR